ncbi:MAG: hypothetical protein M1832_000746 [Thelocarpon impressellum]|nr:MAG: hypothetical protein M1832_000746 [Thelocarpon impressellum]
MRLPLSLAVGAASVAMTVLRRFGVSLAGGPRMCAPPSRRRASRAQPPTGNNATLQLPDAATLDALDAEEMSVGDGTGPRRMLLGAERPSFESRFPDVIVVDGVSYSDKHRGDLVYRNAAGEQLDLLAHARHQRSKKQAELGPAGAEKTAARECISQGGTVSLKVLGCPHIYGHHPSLHRWMPWQLQTDDDDGRRTACCFAPPVQSHTLHAPHGFSSFPQYTNATSLVSPTPG